MELSMAFYLKAMHIALDILNPNLLLNKATQVIYS